MPLTNEFQILNITGVWNRNASKQLVSVLGLLAYIFV